jgi:hypothetical protein
VTRGLNVTSAKVEKQNLHESCVWAWTRDFLFNTGTIFSGVIGAIISGVMPTFYPRFSAKLGYAITTLISLLLGSYLSYRKQFDRANRAETALADKTKQRQCEIELLQIITETPSGAATGKKLLGVNARIQIRNGEQSTSVLLKDINLHSVPQAEFALNPYWRSDNSPAAKVISLGSGQQWIDIIRCLFVVPENSLDRNLTIEFAFDETYRGIISVQGELAIPARVRQI